MKNLEIKGRAGASRILVGESLENFPRYCPSGRVIVVTDKNVNTLYNSRFRDYPVIEIGVGESVKTLETVALIYERLLDLNADRSSFLFAVGGGVVCDIAGFAASTYMRGIDFGYGPTTLLSQADAGVGGKTGVNFGGFKNIVGVFSQPSFVICDPGTLRTLPQEEILNGLAEVVKHAVIGDPELFTILESRPLQTFELEPGFLEDLIYRSLRVKVGIVEKDERERDERRKLNFGHTFGHAAEALTGLPHGRAVSLGMDAAARFSVRKGLLPQPEAERIFRLLEAMGLKPDVRLDPARVMNTLKKDKKKAGDKIRFVFLRGIGRPVIEDVSFEELEPALHDLR